MLDIDAVAEQHYATMHDEYFNKEYEEDKEICAGEDCDNIVEQYGELCKDCQHLLQKCVSNFLSQFNNEEQEYIKEYMGEV